MSRTEATERIKLDLNPKQFRAIRSHAKVIIYLAGIGAGKSRVSGHWLLERAKVPGSLGLVVATDSQQMKLAVLPAIQEAWEAQGYFEEEHYVINKRPPRHWGVETYSTLGSANILTWYWGSYLVMGGTENFNSYRGAPYDYILGDEVRDWRDIDGTMKVFFGRLRGKAYKERGLQSQLMLATSPPDDPEELEAYFSGKTVEVIRGTTMDNLANLPDDYLETLEDTYDEFTYRREVLGELVQLGGLRVGHAFVNEPYERGGNLCEAGFSKTARSYLTMDYNSGATRPMSWILIQELQLRDPKSGLERVYEVATREWVNLGTNTTTQATIVYDDLISSGFVGELHGRGDATGGDKARGSAATKSDHEIVERRLRNAPWVWKGILTRRTSRIKNRFAAMNARFRTYPANHVMLLVNRRLCPKLGAGILKLRYKANGYELEDNPHNDPVTALSYKPYYDNPVHRKEREIVHSR